MWPQSTRMIKKEELDKLIEKYDGSVPRYTSYPTAPEWTDEYSQEKFENAIKESNRTENDYSLYLHIPFCESQCYYCACNVVISKEHGIEQKYLEKLKEELNYYGDIIKKSRKVIQMAWGGGTPTYLSPEQIIDLSNHINKHFSLYPRQSLKAMAQQAKDLSPNPDHEYAIEIDPRVSTKEHLEALWQSGFNRLSLGIQDFNQETQEAINRIQSYEVVEKLVNQARDIGFESINFDLIYGLPFQSLDSFEKTINKVKDLDPERIALFNYAHIPQIFPFQKKYIDESKLPNKDLKTKIFDRAIECFTKHGYEFIGLDHFAKPNDSLAIAQKNKSLYRNFQGYTTHSGADLYGFGITAISDVQGAFKQNYKKLYDYYDNPFGAEKFKICSKDDKERREIIKQIMCNGFVVIDAQKYSNELKALEAMIEDSLVEYKNNQDNKEILLKVTDKGRIFVRNIASIFDTYISKKKSHKIFSNSL